MELLNSLKESENINNVNLLAVSITNGFHEFDLNFEITTFDDSGSLLRTIKSLNKDLLISKEYNKEKKISNINITLKSTNKIQIDNFKMLLYQIIIAINNDILNETVFDYSLYYEGFYNKYSGKYFVIRNNAKRYLELPKQ